VGKGRFAASVIERGFSCLRGKKKTGGTGKGRFTPVEDRFGFLKKSPLPRKKRKVGGKRKEHQSRLKFIS